MPFFYNILFLFLRTISQHVSIVITCPRGCGQFLKQEIQRLGYTIVETQTTFVRIVAPESAIARINIWSRIAHKVYIELKRVPCDDFDYYFAMVQAIDRQRYIAVGEKLVIKAVSHKHTLVSTKTLQSLGLKATIQSLVGDKHWVVYDHQPQREIRVVAADGMVSVMLDTSGEPLWKRGYRQETGDAPIKENIAVALLLSL